MVVIKQIKNDIINNVNDWISLFIIIILMSNIMSIFYTDYGPPLSRVLRVSTIISR